MHVGARLDILSLYRKVWNLGDIYIKWRQHRLANAFLLVRRISGGGKKEEENMPSTTCLLLLKASETVCIFFYPPLRLRKPLSWGGLTILNKRHDAMKLSSCETATEGTLKKNKKKKCFWLILKSSAVLGKSEERRRKAPALKTPCMHHALTTFGSLSEIQTDIMCLKIWLKGYANAAPYLHHFSLAVTMQT